MTEPCGCEILKRGRAPADGPAEIQDLFISPCALHAQVEAGIQLLQAAHRLLPNTPTKTEIAQFLDDLGYCLYTAGSHATPDMPPVDGDEPVIGPDGTS